MNKRDMEEFELEDMFPEYEDMTNEDLDETLDDLNDRLLFGDDPLVAERITRINYLLNEGEAETSFIDLESRVANDTFVQLDKYVQDSRGGKLNPYSDSAIELRSRTSVRDGKVVFRERLKSGAFSSVEKIVLNRDGDTYTKNTARRNTNAASQFEELVDKAVSESMTRDVTNKSLPMIDRRGLSIPPDVLRRLSEADQRVVNGVLNPSDTILPESRVGDRGANLR